MQIGPSLGGRGKAWKLDWTLETGSGTLAMMENPQSQ